MKIVNFIFLICFLLVYVSCSKDTTGNNNNITELEGTWIGYEINEKNDEWTLSFSGNNYESHNQNYEESYNGTFIINTEILPKQIDLLFEECSYPEYIGTTGLGIYEIEGDTLTYASNPPGFSSRPEDFSSDLFTRLFVFTKQ